MKSTSLGFLCLALFCLAPAWPRPAYGGEQLIPAGSLIQCTVSEPKFNSKTAQVGDPVLCQVGYTARYGLYTLPYETYLAGRFEDYKDPGRLVGKGWMQLEFDRMVIEPDTVVPLNARIVNVPGYNIDRQGRILGKGHPVRDAVEWSIPILWPIDLMNLPRRGPRPTLRNETRLTLKLMDDALIPAAAPAGELPEQEPQLLRRPSAYIVPAQPDPQPEQKPAPAVAAPARPAYVAVPAPPPPGYAYVAPRPVYVSPYAEAWTGRMMVVVRNGISYLVPAVR
jgi:hypothetical protein